MKHLLKHGLIHGDAVTCTGKTVAENLADVPELGTDQDVIFPFDAPLAPAGRHIRILKVRCTSGDTPAHPLSPISHLPSPISLG